MSTLRELYEEHDGKVSDRWTLYLQTYERLLSGWRDRDLRLLEIGIQNGGSLEVWAKYFPRARSMVGCDINPLCANLRFDDPRVQVIVGNANTDEVQGRIQAISPILDLIIDDGSHTSSDIVRSFARYFPMLADGGMFIAEDLHCSYWSAFEGGLYDLSSSVSFFKALADVVNHEHWGMPYRRAEVLTPFRECWGIDVDEDQLARIHSIEFLNSICVVRKADAAANILGPRVVTRGEEAVAGGHHALAGSSIERYEQTENPLAAATAEPTAKMRAQAAEIARLAARVQELSAMLDRVGAEDRRRIGELEARLARQEREWRVTRDQLGQASARIEAMQASRSWRYTAGMRALGTLLRPRNHG